MLQFSQLNSQIFTKLLRLPELSCRQLTSAKSNKIPYVMAAYAFIIMPNKLANDSSILPSTHSLSPPTPFQLPNALNLRFEQSSEQVQRRCLTNMSYQHLWHFYEALTPTPTHTHTLGCNGLAARGAGIKLSQTVRVCKNHSSAK